jgi:hypothetical protein
LAIALGRFGWVSGGEMTGLHPAAHGIGSFPAGLD